MKEEEKSKQLPNLYYTKKLEFTADSRDDLFYYFSEDEYKVVKKAVTTDALKLTSQELETLLSCMPELLFIELRYSENCKLYTEYLRDTGNTQHLQYIKEVCNRGESFLKSSLAHFEACHNFCATLTHLSVCLDNSSTSGDILKSLGEFKQLVNLKIANLLERHLTTSDIQQLCPILTSLEFLTAFNTPDDRVNEEFSSSINNPRINLEHLVVGYPQVTYTHMKCLKTVYPAGSLNKRWIAMNAIDLHD